MAPRPGCAALFSFPFNTSKQMIPIISVEKSAKKYHKCKIRLEDFFPFIFFFFLLSSFFLIYIFPYPFFLFFFCSFTLMPKRERTIRPNYSGLTKERCINNIKYNGSSHDNSFAIQSTVPQITLTVPRLLNLISLFVPLFSGPLCCPVFSLVLVRFLFTAVEDRALTAK